MFNRVAPGCRVHNVASKVSTVKSDGPNKGRKFYSCCRAIGLQCMFFMYADEEQNPALLSPKNGDVKQ